MNTHSQAHTHTRTHSQTHAHTKVHPHTRSHTQAIGNTGFIELPPIDSVAAKLYFRYFSDLPSDFKSSVARHQISSTTFYRTPGRFQSIFRRVRLAAGIETTRTRQLYNFSMGTWVMIFSERSKPFFRCFRVQIFDSG